MVTGYHLRYFAADSRELRQSPSHIVRTDVVSRPVSRLRSTATLRNGVAGKAGAYHIQGRFAYVTGVGGSCGTSSGVLRCPGDR